MEENVKAIRTMREFVLWYEINYLNIKPQELSLELNEFYIKFKYLIKQEDEINEYMKNFLA